MKKVLAVLFGVSISAQLYAQLTVEVHADQDQYLPGEAVSVAVRISNLSGQTLHLGTGDWLQFSVESKDGFLVSQTGKLPIEGEFTLESSKAAIKHVNIAAGYDLGRPGIYSVGATVNVADWNQQFNARPKDFTVMQGTKLWEQSVGLPVEGKQSPTAPEVRKYVLQQANYLKELKLYVRVTDAAEGRIIRVLQAGPMVSFTRPEAQIDKASNLHLLWQTGARSFAYRVINPNGEIVGKQTYLYSDSRPHLGFVEGELTVKGGLKETTPEDMTPPGAGQR